jgi:hypothetical protein
MVRIAGNCVLDGVVGNGPRRKSGHHSARARQRLKLYDGPSGAINFRVYTYVRYLNQKALDGN